MTTAHMRNALRLWGFPTLVSTLVLSGCAAPDLSTMGSGGRAADQEPGRTKVLNLAITTNVTAMGPISQSTPTGGWGGIHEVHSQGLITTAKTSTLVGRLAERVPSVEDGSVSVLPDGRMRVVYHLRKGVTWQDGAPFTAHDLTFSFKPLVHYAVSGNGMVGMMESVEATDDYTVAFTYRASHYLGNVLLINKFWPLPRHVLEPAYEGAVTSGKPDEFVNHPYWTTEYVHLGPFRLTSLDPGVGLQFRAYEGYFLGRPKVDVINVRVFANENSAFAELLAGTIDMFMAYALSDELIAEVKARWERDGGGTVHSRSDVTRSLYPQMRPDYQREPANLDPRVRGALYQAIDRDSLASVRGAQGAWSILPPGDLLYEATKDGLRRYPYDPERARAILRDLGWALGPDGILRNSGDGRRFQTQFSMLPNQYWVMPIVADFWRRIGLAVEEIPIPAALARDGEHRSTYPGWEESSGGYADAFLNRFQGPAATAPRWGGNRGGYDDPTANALAARYIVSLSERDQFQAMKAINDFFVEILPSLSMYFSAEFLGKRRGVIAFDDVEGSGPGSANRLGSESRNSHLWDIE